MKDNQISNTCELLKAISHPTRLQIIKSLLSGKKCVTNIIELIGKKQANISQHLKILRLSGVVDFERNGNNSCFYLNDEEFFVKLFNLIENNK